MRKFTIIAALIIAAAFVGSAMAAPPGKTRRISGRHGQSHFDGKTHADKGLNVTICHKDKTPFEMKKGTAKIKMADS